MPEQCSAMLNLPVYDDGKFERYEMVRCKGSAGEEGLCPFHEKLADRSDADG